MLRVICTALWAATVALAVNAHPAAANMVTISIEGTAYICDPSACSVGERALMSVTFDSSVTGIRGPTQPAEALSYFGAITDLKIGSFDFTAPSVGNQITLYNNFFNGVEFLDTFAVSVDNGTTNANFYLDSADLHSQPTLLSSLQLPTSLDESKVSVFIGGVALDRPDGSTLELVGPVSSIPEPSAWVMMLIGFAGMIFLIRRPPVVARSAEGRIQ